jgi:proteasome beta subunit
MTFSERPPLGVPAGLGAYLAPGVTSFTDFVAATAPHLMPGQVPQGVMPAHGGGAAGRLDVPHGTTVVALTFADGVVIAGDRRATQGNVIAQRDIEKVFVTDSHSAVGFAGTAGNGLQMVRLFSVDLEHYEKTEGVPLSLDGKANKLAAMVQANLAAALQGFVVVPILVGYDVDAEPAKAGRIVTYDAAGGRYDELLGYHAIGSGSVFAKSALKKRHDPGADLPGAVRAAVESLYDAADDDTATGGPDLTRRIFPVVASITGPDGAVRRPEDEIEAVVREVVAGRTENPGG